MRLGNAIADLTPALLVAATIGMLAAVLTFGALFVLTAKLSLGLDFFIIVGLVISGIVGIGASIVAFRIIRFRIST